MKVNMEVSEDRHSVSLFRSVDVFRLTVSVEFSEVEKEALKRSGAMKQIFLSYNLHPEDKTARSLFEGDQGHVQVDWLVKNSGCKPYYLTQVDAQNAMSEVEEQFRKLKQNILAVDAPKTKSLEF